MQVDKLADSIEKEVNTVCNTVAKVEGKVLVTKEATRIAVVKIETVGHKLLKALFGTLVNGLADMEMQALG